ncbi:MAG: hypothetical protein HRT47_11335 [Candidatus Caenarcaniphilales bacterium]|nr:hypothetical protein [Candidatus Caenarcaniphilales bacterium]
MSTNISAYIPQAPISRASATYDKVAEALANPENKKELLGELFNPVVSQSDLDFTYPKLIDSISEFLDKYIQKGEEEIFKPNWNLNNYLETMDNHINPDNEVDGSALAITIDNAIDARLLEHVDIKEADNGGLKIIFPPAMENLKSITLNQVDGYNREFLIEFRNSDEPKLVTIKGRAGNNNHGLFDDSLNKIQAKLDSLPDF